MLTTPTMSKRGHTADPQPDQSQAGPEPRPAPTQKPGSAHARRRLAWITGIILSIGVLAAVFISAAVGQFHTSPMEVTESLWRVLFQGADPLGSRLDATLWTIRFPRTLLAFLVGACLALAGTVMQGVFANPLAEPSIIGVSAGASVGASACIVFGFSAAGVWVLPTGAFLGALVITACVWVLARGGGKAVVLTLVLTGIAINAIASALTSFLVFLADTTSREQIVFWQMGSMAAARWEHVAVMAVVLALGTLACVSLRHQLDVLSLGDVSARGVGINVERLRLISIVLVCILTGTAVAFSGMIAFVGLIVPHALRLVVGPSHRYLVPLSLVGGALLLGLADIAARTVIPFGDVPIGIFTALVGGPLFMVLLRRTLKKTGANP